ncbi:MAG: acetylxylan esterase [Opitutaceae bacterium]
MQLRSLFSATLAAVLLTAAPSVVRGATPLAPLPPQAQLRVATVQIRVTPDHRDWTYRLGESARFSVAVVADNTPLDHATVTYSVGPEMMPAATQTAEVPLAGLVIDGGTMRDPGFLRCTVTAEFAGRTYKGVATAAFSPEQIVPYQTEPADFDAFWKTAKEELAATPVDAIATLLPERCTAKVNVYHVSFRVPSPSWMKTPARIYGILCEPKAPGRYPAVLKVPGAGVRPYSGDVGLAERGALVLEIGVHGLPVNLAPEIYDQLYAGALNGYWLYNLDDPKSYYYRRIYQGCLRANDFLTSLASWDGKHLLVMGASQGGQLSIVTAGLDERVTALAATHPAACDYAAELHGRAGGWPHPFKPNDDGSPSSHATPAKIATAAYFDTVNFARRVKAPGFYCWGYNDDVCPPTSVWAAFNVISAPKQFAVTLELAHSYTPEQWEAINAWVCATLGLK